MGAGGPGMGGWQLATLSWVLQELPGLKRATFSRPRPPARRQLHPMVGHGGTHLSLGHHHRASQFHLWRLCCNRITAQLLTLPISLPHVGANPRNTSWYPSFQQISASENEPARVQICLCHLLAKQLSLSPSYLSLLVPRFPHLSKGVMIIPASWSCYND